VFRGLDLSLDAGERVALVGRNGCGKSTLVRILAGVEAPDEGEVILRSGLRVGHLEQEPRFDGTPTATEAVLDGLAGWQRAVELHAAATARIAAGGGDLASLVGEQAAAAARVEELGGWDLRHEALGMLDHLGVARPDTPVDRLSGGERRRVALARLLVAAPDLAVLDEPTNHLDLDTIAWLERWILERFRGAVVLVTHDRHLLDAVATRTLELDGGRLYSYEGGWSRYLEARAERVAHEGRVEDNRRNFLRRELEWLRRTPKARTTKQKARIDRVEAARDLRPRPTPSTANIELGAVRSGRTVLDAEGVAVDVAQRRLVRDVTLRLSQGERLGILGPNGCGKTSLLRVLCGLDPPAVGRVVLGKATRIAYLDQVRSGLDDARSIFENVAEGRARILLGERELEVRAYLERFAFSSAEQGRVVGSLSGGERARVALARTLRDAANLVVLDEPTNDLDVMTLAAFEDALCDFRGTLLVVTHDRWFLDRMATSLLVFEGGVVVRHEGGYSDWRERVAAEPAAGAAAAARRPPERATRRTSERRGLPWAEKKELEGLPARIEAAEAQARALLTQVAEAGFYEQPEPRQREVFEALRRAEQATEELTARWLELEERRAAQEP
jgi:ATP-binding cassette subfamily F protein uup